MPTGRLYGAAMNAHQAMNDCPRSGRLFRFVRVAVAALVGAGIMWVAGTPPAHADGNAYIADLQAAGVPIWTNPETVIAKGYAICGELRNGAPVDVVAHSFGFLSVWGPPAVAAAQRDLCPDTLGH